jgi:uncharacterized protein YnzC (UPF0291/DUF896 family)
VAKLNGFSTRQGGNVMSIEDTIARINELARKAKNDDLSEEELIERAELRRIYIKNFKSSLKQQLDQIEFQDEAPTDHKGKTGGIH